MDVDTEQDRVLFIKSVAQFMVCIISYKNFEFLNEKDANRELKQTTMTTSTVIRMSPYERHNSFDSP